MTCNLCGRQNQGGRLCSDCALEEHLDNRERHTTDQNQASLRDSETPDEDTHASRTAEMLRQADEELDGQEEDDV